jgi:hypothetical protein
VDHVNNNDHDMQDKVVGALARGYRRGQAAEFTDCHCSTVWPHLKSDPVYRQRCLDAEIASRDGVETAMQEPPCEGGYQCGKSWLDSTKPEPWGPPAKTAAVSLTTNSPYEPINIFMLLRLREVCLRYVRRHVLFFLRLHC